MSSKSENLTRIRAKDLRGFAKKKQGSGSLIQLMAEPDRLFSNKHAVIIKNSGTAASLCFKSDDSAIEIFLKRFNVKGILSVLKNCFRCSRAKKAWDAANSMAERDIPTPEPLMFLEQRRFGVFFKSYFVSKSMANTTTLDSYVSSCFKHLSQNRKASLIRILACCVRKMHDQGVFHGDLKAKNILIQEQKNGEEKVFFVDLDATRVKDSLQFRDRCKDMARLNCSFLNRAIVSKTHRFYFLKCYFGTVRPEELKRGWDRVLYFTEKKLKKSGRNFVPERFQPKQR